MLLLYLRIIRFMIILCHYIIMLIILFNALASLSLSLSLSFLIFATTGMISVSSRVCAQGRPG